MWLYIFRSISLLSIIVLKCSNIEALSEFKTKYSLTENQRAGTRVGILADDLGSGFTRHSSYTYNLNKNKMNLFSLDKKSSILSVSKNLDLEYICGPEGTGDCSDDYGIVKLTVSVWDGSQLIATIAVDVKVLDENDNAPIFDSSPFTKELRELVYLKNSKVDLPQAKDIDVSPENRKIQYSLAQPSAMFKLEVNSEGRPSLRLLQDLDYETQTSYDLVLRAWNPSRPSVVDKLSIVLDVLNINDNMPTFSSNSYAVNVSESTKVHSVIYQLKAVDRDPDAKLVYSMTDKKADVPFRVEPDGRVTLAQSLDYEKKKEYQLPVQASDGEFVGATKLNIYVTDVNDEPPLFTLNPPNLSVEENTVPNSAVGVVKIADGDTPNVIGGVFCHEPHRNQSLRFHPDPKDSPTVAKYQLYTRQKLDREQLYPDSGPVRGTLLIYLVCRDDSSPEGGPRLTSTLTATLTITDKNDNAPVFSRPSYDVTIMENNDKGANITLANATDLDSGNNARITYSLENLRDDFEIDPVTGLIRARSSFNREVTDSYQLTVKASDNGVNPLTATTIINVRILDANDHIPQLLEPTNFNVMENLPPNQRIGQLKFEDRDIGLNGQVIFSLGSSTNTSMFRLTPDGTLYSIVSFDREAQSEHCIEVRLQDRNEKEPFSNSGTVCIRILDQNDNAPRFTAPLGPGVGHTVNKGVNGGASDSNANISVYHLSVHESPMFPVLTAQAVDPDQNDNGRVHYKLQDPRQPTSRELFVMDANTGVLKLAHRLTRSHIGLQSVTLLAEDSGKPPKSATRTVHIMIADVPAKGNNFGLGPGGQSSSLGGRNVMVVIILSSVTAFLASVLITAILCMIRPWHHRPRPRPNMAGHMVGGGGAGDNLYLNKMSEMDAGGGTLLKGMGGGGLPHGGSYLPGQYHHHGCHLGPPDHGWNMNSLRRGSGLGEGKPGMYCDMDGCRTDLIGETVLMEDDRELEPLHTLPYSTQGSLMQHQSLLRGHAPGSDQVRVWTYDPATGASHPSLQHHTPGQPGGGLLPVNGPGEEHQSDSGRGGSDEEMNNYPTSQRHKKPGFNNMLYTFQPTGSNPLSGQHDTSFSSGNHANNNNTATLSRCYGSPNNGTLSRNNLPPSSHHSTLPPTSDSHNSALSSVPMSSGLPPTTTAVSPYARLNPHTQKLLQQYNTTSIPTTTSISSEANTPMPAPRTSALPVNSYAPVSTSLQNRTAVASFGSSNVGSHPRFQPSYQQPTTLATITATTSLVSAPRVTTSSGTLGRPTPGIGPSTPLLSDVTNPSDVNGSRVDPEKLCNEIDQLFFKDML